MSGKKECSECYWWNRFLERCLVMEAEEGHCEGGEIPFHIEEGE